MCLDPRTEELMRKWSDENAIRPGDGRTPDEVGARRWKEFWELYSYLETQQTPVDREKWGQPRLKRARQRTEMARHSISETNLPSDMGEPPELHHGAENAPTNEFALNGLYEPIWEGDENEC